MALEFECGSFTWPNTTAAQTINLVNTSLTPKAVIFWTTGPGATGFSAGSIYSMGFGTRRGGSTQSGCSGIFNADNVATSDLARVRNTTLLHVLANATTTDYTITLNSFGTGTIAVTSSSGANSNGDTIHYMAFGGTDITDANVLNWLMDSNIGTEVVTGVGFQPNVMFALGPGTPTANSIVAGMGFSFGFASSPTEHAAFITQGDDADTMTSGMSWNVNYRNDNVVLNVVANGSGTDARYDLDSFDSDGATLGIPDTPAVLDSVCPMLFIQGGTWEAGQAAKDTDTGTDDFALSNAALTPVGVIMFGVNGNVANTQTAAVTHFAIGAMDAAGHEQAGGITGTEAINTANDRYWISTKAMVEITGNTPTLTSSADFSSLSAGAFQLNWNVNGGTANLISYLAFGSSPIAGQPSMSRWNGIPGMKYTRRTHGW
jgi:hypothetical protein